MRGHVGALLLSLFAAGCGCSPQDCSTFVDGQHVRVCYRPGDEVCSGTVPFMDLAISRLANYLGTPVPNRIIYDYCPAAECTAACGNSSIPNPGCTDSITGRIQAREVPIVHELVHAIEILGRQPGDSDRFFSEGEAVALGIEDARGLPDYSLAPRDWLDQAALAPNLYPTAGDFVSYLLDQYGVGPFGRLRVMIPYGLPAAAVENAFASTYGTTFEQAVADRLASAVRFGHGRLAFLECNAIDPQPWMGSTWSLDTSVACDQNGIGPVNSTSVFRFAATDVPAPSLYRVGLRVDADAYLFLRSCASGQGLFYAARGSRQVAGFSSLMVAAFDSGRHHIRLESPTGAPTTFNVTLEPTTIASNSCSFAGPVSIDSSIDTIDIFPVSNSAPVLIQFRVTRARNALALADTFSSMELCAGTCQIAGCPSLVPGISITLLDPSQTYTLVAHPAMATYEPFIGLAFLD